MLAEVRQDNKENDAEHMKPVSNNARIVCLEVCANYPSRRSDELCTPPLYITRLALHSAE